MAKKKMTAEDIMNEILHSPTLGEVEYKSEGGVGLFLSHINEQNIDISINGKEGRIPLVIDKIYDPENNIDETISELENFKEETGELRSFKQGTMNDVVDRKLDMERVMEFVPEKNKKYYKLFGTVFSKVANVFMNGVFANKKNKDTNTAQLMDIFLSKRLSTEFEQLGEYYKRLQEVSLSMEQKNKIVNLLEDISSDFRLISKAVENELRAKIAVKETIGLG